MTVIDYRYIALLLLLLLQFFAIVQVIVVASSFMNPTESRAPQNLNLNRVRIFGSDQLSKAVAGQKWDRAKVVCTQPFNKVGKI